MAQFLLNILFDNNEELFVKLFRKASEESIWNDDLGFKGANIPRSLELKIEDGK